MPGPGTYKVYSEFGDVSDFKHQRMHTDVNTTTVTKGNEPTTTEGN